MNQILITKKIYVTPDMDKKRKMYKFNFFISIFLVCLLFSFYIYAEYDKSKNEAYSREILASLDLQQQGDVSIDNTIMKVEDNVLMVVLDEENTEEVNLSQFENKPETHVSESGDEYYITGVVSVPKLNISYPIISKSTMELLKISVCKLWGPEPNEVGNLCLVAHNYRNDKFFSKIATLENGDIIQIQDSNGKILEYEVYTKYEVQPDDVSCTSQLTDGKREVTLITCTSDSLRRTVVKAVAK